MGRKDTADSGGKSLPDVSPASPRNELLQSRTTQAGTQSYNAVMKKSLRHFVLLCLAATAFPAIAQGEPPPPPPGYGYQGQMQRQRDWRDQSPEQREQWREDRRQQRREQWRDMSPEERHQLRRDIRDAGRMYRRGPHRD
jgi:hypothetical protein